MPVTRPVRVVTGCNSSTPVRVVTAGGDPVRIVTEGVSDPVRIVTGGASTPVVVIGGGLAPDAPTFVSGEVGTVDASTVVVTFSTDITAPCGDCGLGFTVLVNAAPNAITACVIVGGNTVRLTLTNPVAFGDAVTISYDSAVGCIMESTGITDLATFPAQAVTNNIVGNGLLNNLIAYWPGNEVNGNALDMHTNALTLTATNNPGSGVGNVYALSRTYNGINQLHSRVSEALLNIGNNDATLAIWVNPTSLAANSAFFHKWVTSLSWLLQMNNTTGTITLQLSANGAAASLNITTTDVVTTGNWYLILFTYAFNGDANIYINNGVPISGTPSAAGIFAGTSPLFIGAYAVGTLMYAGIAGPTMYWRSAPGLGGVLTAAQRTALYNAGAGLPYASFTV